MIFTSRSLIYLQLNPWCFLRILSKRHLMLGSIGGLDKATKSQKQELGWMAGLGRSFPGRGGKVPLTLRSHKFSGSALSLMGDWGRTMERWDVITKSSPWEDTNSGLVSKSRAQVEAGDNGSMNHTEFGVNQRKPSQHHQILHFDMCASNITFMDVSP